MLVEVALPLPLPRTFTYRVPGGSALPGTRVRVAFGPRKLMGWIVAQTSGTTEIAKIKDVDALLETQPSVTPDVLELCRWVSDYYVLPLGHVLRAALPAVLGRSEERRVGKEGQLGLETQPTEHMTVTPVRRRR